MENTFKVGKPIEVRGRSSNVDALYGPYNSLEEANASIERSRRIIGRTVVIVENGKAVEYWYKEGIEDDNLVLKIPDNTPKLEYVNPEEGSKFTGNVGEPLKEVEV